MPVSFYAAFLIVLFWVPGLNIYKIISRPIGIKPSYTYNVDAGMTG